MATVSTSTEAELREYVSNTYWIEPPAHQINGQSTTISVDQLETEIASAAG